MSGVADEGAGRKKVYILCSGEAHCFCASQALGKPLAVQTTVSLSTNKEARVQMRAYLLCQRPGQAVCVHL